MSNLQDENQLLDQEVALMSSELNLIVSDENQNQLLLIQMKSDLENLLDKESMIENSKSITSEYDQQISILKDDIQQVQMNQAIAEEKNQIVKTSLEEELEMLKRQLLNTHAALLAKTAESQSLQDLYQQVDEECKMLEENLQNTDTFNSKKAHEESLFEELKTEIHDLQTELRINQDENGLIQQTLVENASLFRNTIVKLKEAHIIESKLIQKDDQELSLGIVESAFIDQSSNISLDVYNISLDVHEEEIGKIWNLFDHYKEQAELTESHLKDQIDNLKVIITQMEYAELDSEIALINPMMDLIELENKRLQLEECLRQEEESGVEKQKEIKHLHEKYTLELKSQKEAFELDLVSMKSTIQSLQSEKDYIQNQLELESDSIHIIKETTFKRVAELQSTILNMQETLDRQKLHAISLLNKSYSNTKLIKSQLDSYRIQLQESDALISELKSQLYDADDLIIELHDQSLQEQNMIKELTTDDVNELDTSIDLKDADDVQVDPQSNLIISSDKLDMERSLDLLNEIDDHLKVTFDLLETTALLENASKENKQMELELTSQKEAFELDFVAMKSTIQSLQSERDDIQNQLELESKSIHIIQEATSNRISELQSNILNMQETLDRQKLHAVSLLNKSYSNTKLIQHQLNSYKQQFLEANEFISELKVQLYEADELIIDLHDQSLLEKNMIHETIEMDTLDKEESVKVKDSDDLKDAQVELQLLQSTLNDKMELNTSLERLNEIDDHLETTNDLLETTILLENACKEKEQMRLECLRLQNESAEISEVKNNLETSLQTIQQDMALQLDQLKDILQNLIKKTSSNGDLKESKSGKSKKSKSSLKLDHNPNTLIQSVSEIKNLIDDYQLQVENLEKSKSALENTLIETQSQLQEKAKKDIKQSEDNLELQSALKKATLELQDQSIFSSKTVALNQELSDTLEKAKLDLQEKKKYNSELSRMKDQVERELNQIKQELINKKSQDESISKLNAQLKIQLENSELLLEKSNARISELDIQLKNAQDEVKKSHSVLIQVQENLDKLETDFDLTRNENYQLKNVISKHENELKNLSEKKEELVSNYNQLKQDYDVKEERLKALQNEFSKLLDSKDKLNLSLEDSKKYLDGKIKINELLSNLNGDLKEDLEKIRLEYRDKIIAFEALSRDHESIKALLHKARLQNQDLETQVAELGSQLEMFHQLQIDFDIVVNEKNALIHEKDNFLTEINELKDSNENKSTKIRDLQDMIDTTNTQMTHFE